MNQMKEGSNSSASVVVQLSSEPDVRSMGGSIPIKLTYVNRGKTPISFREPSKTWEVHLLIGRPKADPTEVALGRIFYHKEGKMEYRSIEDAETINLPPGAQYDLTYDVGERWPELFLPGVNLIRVKDLTNDERTVMSNTVEIRVAFNLETFPRLVEILNDKESTVDSREFAEEWIKKLHPGFHAGREGVSEARIWWTKHEKDPETLKQIEALNREPARAR